MTAFKLISLNMRMATEKDSHLPTYDHTKLSNINTCPTWGILRYSKHKAMPNSKRSMALEAGITAHEGFAAIRWIQYRNTCKTKVQRTNLEFHANRLFGERFPGMFDTLSDGATDRTNAINFAITAMESCGFYDDMEDYKRTLSNIEESMIAFIDAYDMERYPIWVRDATDPETDVGIEIAFDIVVDIEYEMGLPVVIREDHISKLHLQVRFTGKLDGLHWNKDNLIIIEEKTGAVLNDHWLAQWILSHQITGYCLASSTFTGQPCNNALISGMRIPIGKVPAEGIRKEYVPRNQLMFEKWACWFVTSIAMEQQFIDDIINAPMYTHSCNRYFNSCSFLPFCAADDIEEKELILTEMEDAEWSPLN